MIQTLKYFLGINQHQGGHPRKGVVDLIPIHPISNITSLEDCASVAIRISEHLQTLKDDAVEKDSPIVDTFLFGSADIPMKRSLVTMRKQVNWYSSNETGNSFRKKMWRENYFKDAKIIYNMIKY